MTLITELINNMITIYSFMIYLGILTVVVILELKYIRIRSRKKNMLPIVLIIIAIILYSVFPARNVTENTTILAMTVLKDTTKIGVQHGLVDRDRNLIAIGQFITNEGIKSRFANIKISKGRVSVGRISRSFSKPINDALRNYNIKINNEVKESLLYNDLVSSKEELNAIRDVDYKHYLFGILIYCLPAISCIVLLIYDKIRRKKKYLMKKMKLKDIN